MSNRRVNVESLLRYAAAFFARQVFERSHVVQSVGEFYDHHANIIDHRKQHLTHIERLSLFTRYVIEFGNLGQPVHKVRDFGAEILLYRIDAGLGIFDYVVQQSSGYADRVEVEVGEQIGNLERMDEVRLARFTSLSAMFAGREEVCAAQEVFIRAGMISANLFEYGLDTNHNGDFRNRSRNLARL